MLPDEEIPADLKSLAAELDALAGLVPAPSGLDGLPDLDGTDFEPIAEIGRGGMGVVYAARQISLDRTVAVKTLAPQIADQEAFRTAFRDESRLVSRLHHPNVIDVYAAGTIRGVCYLAMERVEGSTAADYAFSSLADVVALGATVADALAYAHSCGVLHRDVKPANIFVGAGGTVKLGDFGLACLAGEVGCGSGTRKYMAPEIVRGEPASAAADQFSLGATLLELSAPLLHSPHDADLAAVLDKATQADPKRRYADMTAFANDLRHVLAHEPVTARNASPVQKLRLWSRRNPAACLGTGVALCCLVAFVVALAVGYVRTQQALRQVEDEAGKAALSLALTLTTVDRTGGDYRANEIDRALSTASALAERFPDNEKIRSALGKLRYAKEAHRRIRARRRRESAPDDPKSPRTPGRE